MLYPIELWVRAVVERRAGGGDGFAAGFFYGLMTGLSPEEALRLGWAHGALITTFPGDTTMATLPVSDLKIIEGFGPHLSDMTGVRLSTSAEPERLVKTHCCFCGQQCGIQLKVQDNVVIGFEPWEEFPFNRGMLCPKGVKRYLQGAHPDRVTSSLRRDATSLFHAPKSNQVDSPSRETRMSPSPSLA